MDSDVVVRRRPFGGRSEGSPGVSIVPRVPASALELPQQPTVRSDVRRHQLEPGPGGLWRLGRQNLLLVERIQQVTPLALLLAPPLPGPPAVAGGPFHRGPRRSGCPRALTPQPTTPSFGFLARQTPSTRAGVAHPLPCSTPKAPLRWLPGAAAARPACLPRPAPSGLAFTQLPSSHRWRCQP